MIIKNANIVDGGIFDIYIADGKIADMRVPSEPSNAPDGVIIDGSGLYLMPAFIDTHFHLRNPGQEHKQSLEEAAESLMRGGFQAFVAMANTSPVLDNSYDIEAVQASFSKFPPKLYQASALSKGLKGVELVDFKDLMRFTAIFTDDGKNVDNEVLMKEALALSDELGFTIMDHSEPEVEMVIRNLRLQREAGGRLHFCHISKKTSVEAIVAAKEGGQAVSFEVSPHHLFASGLSYRVNPPFGGEEDRLALIAAVKSGYVDYIGTDHAPHTAEDKLNGSPGIANVESAYSMVMTALKEHGLDNSIVKRLMSDNAAKLLNIDNEVRVGNTANLVLVRDCDGTIKINKYFSRSKNSPFDARKIRAEVAMTILNGEIVYDSNIGGGDC